MKGRPKCRCRFLVPVNYNDGTPVEAEFFIEMKTILDTTFGGYRIVGTSEGCWQGQIEDTHEIEVAVLPKRVSELRQIVKDIGRRLGQKAMYFDAPDPTVEIIEIEGDDQDEEEPDENENAEGDEE